MRFIFIDKVIKIEKEKQALGIKNLAMSEDYFEHHFPFFPVMPGVLMLEAMTELSRWLVLYSTDFRFFSLLAKLYQVKLRKSAQPGDVLDVRVDWIEKTEMGVLFSGRIFLDGKITTEAKFENRLIEVTSSEAKALLKRNFQFVTTRFQDRIVE